MRRRSRLPPSFVWGAATSAYQVEGAWDADGKGDSIWDRFSHAPGTIEDGSTGDIACDQYHRYPEDVALLSQLGLGAYRFSISWPRIVPAADGRINRAGLDHYARLVDELLKHGIVPFPTLFHWDLPQWVQDRGGWADRGVIGRFADYAEVMVRALGDRVATWTVLNEPFIFVFLGYGQGIHAPGLRDPSLALRASHVVNLAHAEAIRAIHAVAPAAAVGSAIDVESSYAASDDPRDAAAAERYHAIRNAWFLDPLLRGSYPTAFVDQAAALDAMDIRPGDMTTIRADLDFLGLNMYSRALVAHDPAGGAAATRRLAGPGPRTSFDWEIWPAALYRIVCRIDRDYGHPVLYVTENGCAADDRLGADGRVHDPDRIAYLKAHIGQLARAIDDGCDVRGYFAWSLLDNFEWAAGYSQRFGVVWCAFDDGGRRIVKDSGFWLRDLAASGEIEYDDALA